MPFDSLRAAKFFLGVALAQILAIPVFADAILPPLGFASLGNFGVKGVNQYYVEQNANNPVIVDGTGKPFYTGVFIGSAAQGTLEAVFDFTSFTLKMGQTLSLTNGSFAQNLNLFPLVSSPLVLLSQTGMTIGGMITGNGGNGVQGALGTRTALPPLPAGLGGTGYAGGSDGGGRDYRPMGFGPSGGGGGQAGAPATGGGGGGFGGTGGNGEATAGQVAGGTGGAPVATKLIDKLQGGSGGGAGGGPGAGMFNMAISSGGGAGGAAIELSACCYIDITGTINMNGGNGGDSYLGAGGGGSGGGILIAADEVDIGNNGKLLANGGMGGGGAPTGTAGGGGGGGEVYIRTAVGGYTNNGTISVNGGAAGNGDANLAGGNNTVDTDTNFAPCPEPGSVFLLAGICAVLWISGNLPRGLSARPRST